MQYAAKFINLADKDKKEREKVRSEVDIMRNLDHPYIVKMYQYFIECEDGQEKDLIIILECCSQGELYK